MTMNADKLGVCSWSLRASAPSELVELLREVGLARVQLAMSEMAQPGSVWADALDVLRGAGVEVVSGMIAPIGEDYSTLESIRRTGGVVPDATWDANQKMVEAIAALAKRHRLPTITFHAGFIPHGGTGALFNKVVERVGHIADVLSDAGTALLLETGQETAEDLEVFMEACGRPHLGVNFDPANMILYGKGDPIDALRRLRPWVRQVHIKDATASNDPTQWGSEVAVGSGEVDWDAFIGVLRDTGYAGDLVIEREAGATRVDDIRQAARVIMQKLGAM